MQLKVALPSAELIQQLSLSTLRIVVGDRIKGASRMNLATLRKATIQIITEGKW